VPIDPDYKTVPARIADFRTKYPDGSLQPLNPERPYELVEFAGKAFGLYCAAAYRTPDDQRPGVWVAWEPFPGPTNFTRDSELQNAETSAWGRAIVAVLASESKSVASREDVQNRDYENAPAPASSRSGPPVCLACGEPITGKAKRHGDGYVHDPTDCVPEGETGGAF
jgi:hypothetical protein